MRSYTLFFVLLHFFCCTPGTFAARHALLIGVPYTGEKRLQTAYDVSLVANSLQERAGFPAKSIRRLTTHEETTRDMIIQALEQLANDKNVQPGDVVIIYFSGHGTRLADTRERAFVPSDAAHPLTEMDLARLIPPIKNKVRARGNGSVLLVFDCCFSGRLLSRVRSPFAPIVRSLGKPLRPRRHEPPVPAAPQLNERGFVAMMACLPEETAYEMTSGHGETVGQFTYFFVEALSRQEGKRTYRQLFNDIRGRLAQHTSEQTPVAMGDLDTTVFEGALRSRSTMIPALLSRDSNDRTKVVIQLEAGRLHGVTVGSVYELRDRFGIIGQFRVNNTGNTRSQLQPAVPKRAEQLRKASGTISARLVRRRFPGVPLRVDFSQLTRKDASAMKKTLDCWQCDVSQTDRFIVVAKDVADAEVLPVQNGFLLHPITSPSDSGIRFSGVATLQDALDRLAIARYVRQLEAPLNKEVAIEMRLVPIRVVARDPSQPLRNGGTVNAIWHEDVTKADLTVWTEQEWFRIELRNTGTQDAYVSILDIDSNHRISRLGPMDNILVPPDGIWHAVDRSDGSPAPFNPYGHGQDILKAIATLIPTDFYPILTGQDSARDVRSINHPLGRLFQYLHNGQRSTDDPGSWSIATIHFRLQPSQK